MVNSHSVTEAKGPVGLFDTLAVNIKFLKFETHIAPFDSDSDSDADPDRIPLRQQLFGNRIHIAVGGHSRSPYLRSSLPQT